MERSKKGEGVHSHDVHAPNEMAVLVLNQQNNESRIH